MQYQKSLNVVFIVLFVWGFLGISKHHTHHNINMPLQCEVCDITHNLHHHMPSNHVPLVYEIKATEVELAIKKISCKKQFVTTVRPTRVQKVILSNTDIYVKHKSLGFSATAPPVC